jgi:serpin B
MTRARRKRNANREKGQSRRLNWENAQGKPTVWERETEPKPGKCRNLRRESKLHNQSISYSLMIISSARRDSDGRGDYSRQSAVNFALSAWKTQLEIKLDVLFSPYSFYRALAVPALEVLPKVRDAFLETLRFPRSNLSIDEFAAAVRNVASNLHSAGGFVLRDVNNVWINAACNLNDNIFKTCQKHLAVDVSTVTFPQPAIKTINEHIARATDGMIQKALTNEAVDSNTTFLITSALYLHGKWVTEFDPTHTRSEPFTRFDRSTIKTQIMQAKLKVPYAENHQAQIVFLPYADSSCEFVAILPRDNTEAGFRRVLTSLDSSWLDACERRSVRLRLPKFRVIGSALSLNALAKELGLREVFDRTESIFPQMEGETPLAMADIVQQVVIEVDESGTRAAAFTFVSTARCIPPPEVALNLDRPFAYLIRNQVTGTILFMGTYLDPTGCSISG